MRGVIRIGDKLSSGGTVLTGAPGLKFIAREVACVGDKVFCPLPGHGANQIVEGDLGCQYLGRPVALHGHRCACGCLLITSLPQAGRL
ncbi:PAAR domain-containing protein [Pseudomonas sp. P9_2]|uniref:PAAR domain-containing protein n=1 Tax=Pseudomonas sp. P9_2 TaxID=3043447 RepID=UPI002A36A305|nr:PAAR domain-containing protein [Pseudomonas sp. P9_2]WPN51989.1 PAAR domain-containing protein [Pseudomonas sp. P9_2]